MPDDSLDAARVALRRWFGYPDFRSAQVPAVEAVVSGRDALIVLPTGGGKSLCFQVPALLRPGLTLVISPLISLMEDQVQTLQRRGIAADFLNSTLTTDEIARRTARIERGELTLLYVAPERLAVGPTTELLARGTTSLLAIDEAHCVSRWGHDFRPSYLRLPQVRRALGNPQTVALTATATPTVRRDIARLLALRSPREIIGGFDRTNLHLAVTRVRSEAERRSMLLAKLRPPGTTAVVYAATRRQVELFTRVIQQGHVRAVGYHAGMDAHRRAAAQDAFMRGNVPVIVATNAFGMGIDKSDVRVVVHVAASGTLEDYYQEAGRAGRDGAPSRCVLLYRRGDRAVHDGFRARTFPTATLVRQVFTLLLDQGARRRAVPVVPRDLARQCRPAADPGRVARTLELLRLWELLVDEPAEDTVEVRLLSLPVRIRQLRPILGVDARRLVDDMASMDPLAPSWRKVSPTSLGLPRARLLRAMAELESHQLACARARPDMAGIVPDRSASIRLEDAIDSLSKRAEVERAKLDSVVGYATTRSCRRAYILRYFGEQEVSMSCNGCDNCRPVARQRVTR